MLRRFTLKAYKSTLPPSRGHRQLVLLQSDKSQHHAITRGYAAATSRQKRALNKEQLQGEGGTSTSKSSSPAATTATPSDTGAAPSPAPPAFGSANSSRSSGGGGGGMIFAVVAAVGAGGALAYYNGLIPSLNNQKTAKEERSDTKDDKKKVDDDTKKTIVRETDKSSGQKDKEPTDSAASPSLASQADSTGLDESPGPADVTEIVDEGELSAPAVDVAPQSDAEDVTITGGTAPGGWDEEKIMAELRSIKAHLSKESDKALSEAHQELAKVSSLNMDNLDTMTETQLKVRLVQMAKEMEDQSKWEAVRLREFLALKEKEVEDKYVVLIKKLRLEAENLMEQRLAEQKKILTAQAEEALKEQQTASDAFLESSLKIQEQSFNEERGAFEKKVEEAMNAKYEELYGKSLAKVKEDFASKMDKRVKQIESVSQKLSDLETSLKTSHDFQTGSVQAHRITAAAIALTEKLESGEPAGATVDALKAAASDNAVVSSAVDALPPSIVTTGISTLQELQTRFEEEVYPQCRRAVNVPDGQEGLEGQILGSLFARLKYPPAPDDPAPESEKDAADYVLTRARRHVQLGELEQAAAELDKLKGQAHFTVVDWEISVKDRIAVEKALKVIRMECALANESLAQATTDSA